MKINQYLFFILIAIIAFSSCKTYKKTSYVKKTYTEIKETFPEAQTELIKDSIKLIFPNNLVFDLASSVIKQSFSEKLIRFASILNKYQKTNLLITGYTDNSGTEESNIKLSLTRATNVKKFLNLRQISNERLFTWGLGEKSPIATNETEIGRSKNRRVEFVVLYKP